MLRLTRIKGSGFLSDSETILFVTVGVRTLFHLILNGLPYTSCDFSFKFEKIILQLTCNMPSVTGLIPNETVYQIVSFQTIETKIFFSFIKGNIVSSE
jgi:hypothetical protein